MEEEKEKKQQRWERQGKVTGAEEKRATGRRGDRGKKADRHWDGGREGGCRRSWWVQRETEG